MPDVQKKSCLVKGARRLATDTPLMRALHWLLVANRIHYKLCLLMYDVVSTRFVGKPEGVSNVFLTYFDNFFRGVNTNLGVERHQRGVKPPNKSSTGCCVNLSETCAICTLISDFNQVLEATFRFFSVACHPHKTHPASLGHELGTPRQIMLKQLLLRQCFPSDLKFIVFHGSLDPF